MDKAPLIIYGYFLHINGYIHINIGRRNHCPLLSRIQAWCYIDKRTFKHLLSSCYYHKPAPFFIVKHNAGDYTPFLFYEKRGTADCTINHQYWEQMILFFIYSLQCHGAAGKRYHGSLRTKKRTGCSIRFLITQCSYSALVSLWLRW